MTRIREKWRLGSGDPYFPDQLRWLRSHRRLVLRPIQDAARRLLGPRLARYANAALAMAEIGWNRLRVRDPTPRHDRAEGRG
jgi:hypothetical protein